VRLGEVKEVDLDTRRLTIDAYGLRTELPYDSLIVATGADQSYFGHPGLPATRPG
jgi:NADH dehydrogenase